MKALTVRQPWAWAIISGIKTIENRTWRTRYRGPLAIVAGTSRASLTRGTAFIEALGISVPRDLEFGALIGTVMLDDIVPVAGASGPFAEGPWCWMLSSPKALMRPIPMAGRLGLFDLVAESPRMGNRGSSARNHLADAP